MTDFLNDPMILQGFCVALLLLAALFGLLCWEEIQEHRQTRAKYDTLRALWTNKIDMAERLQRMRSGKAPSISAREIRVVASMPAQIEKLRREHAMTKSDRAEQHLRDGDHGGKIKDCPLCQQERKEDRIIARRGDPHPPIHADEEHDWTAANTGEGAQIIILQRALANCYMTARRELHRLNKTGRVELIHGLDSTSVERWQHIIRFCEESGCKSDFLRAVLPTELTDGETNETDYCDDCRTYHTGECPTVGAK